MGVVFAQFVAYAAGPVCGVGWVSFEGRTVDALAIGADEGRGNLRYAWWS